MTRNENEFVNTKMVNNLLFGLVMQWDSPFTGSPRVVWFLPSVQGLVYLPLYESVVAARLFASSTVKLPFAGLDDDLIKK